MEITVAGQAFSFLTALALGALTGLLYDMFRILRVRLPFSLLGHLLDLLFWLAATVALFCHVISAGGGQVRIYFLLAILGGAWIYFLLLSGVALKIGYLLADLVRGLWKIITLPVALLKGTVKKIKATAKKAFHYRRKWYKINLLLEEMEATARRSGGPERGGAVHEEQKGGAVDQAGGSGVAGRHRYGAAQREEPDPPGRGREGVDGGPGGPADPDQRRPGRRRGAQRRPRASGGHRKD